MIVAQTRAELADARAKLTGTVAVVMTMGALHEGHEELMRAARGRADSLIVTIFVNPLQFAPDEDFERYPRTLDKDLAICARNGVDVVFTPAREEMYPTGEPMVRVTPGKLGEILEGASRPGFFHGVLTVVNKLLHLTRPHLAYFGEKDYQQLALVRLLVRDTDLAVEIVGVPIVREPDGLARSSRNRYLSPPERQAALALAAALRAGAAAAADGLGADRALHAARAAFDQAGTGTAETSGRAASAEGSASAVLDYLTLTDPDLGPAPSHGPARMLIAAWVGTTRLIDNAPVALA
jgi:pantoate--beta-alanine ligase